MEYIFTPYFQIIIPTFLSERMIYMEFNSTNELLKSNAEAMQFFNSLNADTQQQLLDKYTGVKSVNELKTFADVIQKKM